MKGVINPYGSTRNPVTNDVLNPREEMIKEEEISTGKTGKENSPKRK